MDWLSLDEVQAVEEILRSAGAEDVSEIQCSLGERGLDIYFFRNELPEVFDCIPAPLGERICTYLKEMSAIDQHESPPQRGAMQVRVDDTEYALTVCTLEGVSEEDILIRVTGL